MKENLETHVAQPLAKWLGASDASERASRIGAAISGLAAMRDVIKLSALADPTERLIRLNRRMIQRIIDDGKPPN